MVKVAGAFCMDRFEASREDATATRAGTQAGRALSRENVLPWQVTSHDQARAACQASGKDLCTPGQWLLGCQGSRRTVYGYGDAYNPTTCNGIDSFGRGGFHLLPTGALASCQSDWGAYDLNGNVWEYTLGGAASEVRGGAYNCSDSVQFHRCDYVPLTWTPSALGFRCCLLPDIVDGGGADAARRDASPGRDAAGPADATPPPDAGVKRDGGGCLDEDAGPGPGDASRPDATRDAGHPDATTRDAGHPDAATRDASRPDATTRDASRPDAAAHDAGHPDASALDATLVDATSPDASAPDAAPAADAGSPSGCPADMVRTASACMDRFEASHDDATAVSQGVSPVAASRENVLPWFPVTLATARDACVRAGKRLCRMDEWVASCHGPLHTTYSYGDTYDPVTCNGIDTFCRCDEPACSALSSCPYPRCFNQAAPGGGGPCGASFGVRPTGSFPDCQDAFGAWDITGNVWELTDTHDGQEHFRGGAYNCSDSVWLHRCDHDGNWGPSARGFRCCLDLP
jgi:formylglycine-generating enzyme required for sulfatase activity